jgi:hypothetical protein
MVVKSKIKSLGLSRLFASQTQAQQDTTGIVPVCHAINLA